MPTVTLSGKVAASSTWSALAREEGREVPTRETKIVAGGWDEKEEEGEGEEDAMAVPLLRRRKRREDRSEARRRRRGSGTRAPKERDEEDMRSAATTTTTPFCLLSPSLFAHALPTVGRRYFFVASPLCVASRAAASRHPIRISQHARSVLATKKLSCVHQR